MQTGVTIQGLDPLLAKIAGVRRGQLQKDLVDNLHKAASPFRADMQAATFTRIQRRAMDSVDVNRAKDGLDMTGGRGNSLGAVLFAGGEFGGRKSKKVTYISRSPRGPSFSVRRRTTMQFLPHLGREGYFLWPTLRDWLPKLHKQTQEIVEDSLGGR